MSRSRVRRRTPLGIKPQIGGGDELAAEYPGKRAIQPIERNASFPICNPSTQPVQLERPEDVFQ
jgi:hypothetical protein